MWYGLVHHFAQWIFCSQEQAEAIYAGIDWWTLDFKTNLASCQFRDPRSQQEFGYVGAPRNVINAVREQQIAVLIWEAKPPDITFKLPAEPVISRPIQAYIDHLLSIRNVYAVPDLPSLRDGITAAGDLASHVRTLRKSKRVLESSTHVEVIRLLKLIERWASRTGSRGEQS